MSRERLVQIALLALPTSTRETRGEEILGTALESVDGESGAGFVRELVDLVAMGLRARSGGHTSRRLVADGFCRGAILVMTLDLSTLLAQKLAGERDPLLSWPSIVGLGITLATALIGAERVAGLAATLWALARLPQLVSHDPTFHGIAPSIVPIACFAVLVVAPRRRGLDLRRLAWLTATIALVAAYGRPHASGVITAVISGAAIIVVLAAVVTIPHDPRLAIACALPAAYVALMVAGKDAAPAWLLGLGAPAVITTAAIGARRVTRRPSRL